MEKKSKRRLGKLSEHTKGLFSEMPLRFHYMIYGDVQGVWFRRFTKQKADELGIVGWVKNDVVNPGAWDQSASSYTSLTQGGCVSGVAAGTSYSALDQL